MTNASDYGLGRVPAADARDGLFGLRRVQGASARTGVKVWDYSFPSLDQNGYGICVGAAWEDWMLTTPVVRKKPGEDPDMKTIYLRCCAIDEFSGNDNGDLYYGTSTRSGAKVMVERGFAKSYVHAQSIEEVGDFVFDQGPMVVGTNWYNDMFGPFNGAFLRVSGGVAGGHAWMLQAVNWDERHFMMRNSWANWGPWGNGMALISFTDLERLLFREGGDAIAAVEVPLAPPPPTPSVLTFDDAQKAGMDRYNAMPDGYKYGKAYYQKQGASYIVQAIADRKAAG